MSPSDLVARPVEEAVDLPALESHLDDQHPWPGLEGYGEGDQEYFKGRSKETEKLYNLIRRERLTLLYGKAGTGKSSLARAGLFPKQRREEALPVWVRLDYSVDAPALGAQVKSALYEAAQLAELEAPEPVQGQSLWEYLHLRKGEFWSSHHRIIMPFIVFDQFEELFTHGLAQQDERRLADIRAFISELSDLSEDRVPANVLTAGVGADRYNRERHHYKLLVCIREEYLAELDRMRDELPPALFNNRMRLTDLTAEQAREVVEQTGRTVGADELSDEIVQRASKDTSEHGRQSEVGVAKSCVNPALLSVLCTTLNQERLRRGAPKVTRSALAAVGPDILSDFYERQLQSLPEVPGGGGWRFGRSRSEIVNDRIADEFMDGHVRVSIPEDRAKKVFGEAALKKLVDDKVLGYTPRGRVELRHDVLPPKIDENRSRWLKRWVDGLRQLIVPALVAAVVAIAASYFIGVERGKNQAAGGTQEEETGDGRGSGSSEGEVPPAPPLNPSNPAQGILWVDSIVGDLNEGTRRLDEAIRFLDVPSFDAATVTLSYLGDFLDDLTPRFCRSSPPGTWRKEQVDAVLDEACDAVASQKAQRATLSELANQDDSALFDPQWRDRVVGQWTAHEATFNTHRDRINEVLREWQAEFPSGS